MVLYDAELLVKQKREDFNTESITLHGQEELDSFVKMDYGKYYEGELILTGAFGNIDNNNKIDNSIKDQQFDYCRFKSITISSSVTSIGNWAFMGCRGLTSLTIPVTVTSIGAYAFHMGGFSSVTIPSSVTYIGGGAFSKCHGLTSVAIPDSVVISDSVMSIGEGVFEACLYLDSVTINSNIDMAKKGTFRSCWVKKIILSDILEYIHEDMFVFNGLTNSLTAIEYNGENIYTKDNFDMETKKLIRPLKIIKNEIEDGTYPKTIVVGAEAAEAAKAAKAKKQLKWIIPVSVVSALLLSFIIFKVVRRRPRKQNKKNKKKSKK
jgi:hypothetical protein